MRKFIILAFLATLFVVTPSIAQTSQFKAKFLEAKEKEISVMVTLVDDNMFTGEVLSVDDTSVQLNTVDGIFNVNYDRMKDVEFVDKLDITSTWYRNPASAKLLITPSGRMERPGNFLYQNTMLFLSTLSVGVTKNISLSGTFSTIQWIPLKDQILIGSAKIGTDVSERLSVAGTFSYYSYDRNSGGGVAMGSTTYSINNLDLTGGVGLALNRKNKSNLAYIIGAQYRMSEKIALLTENIFLPDINNTYEPIHSLGIRFIGKTMAGDVAYVFSKDFEMIAPLVSFIVKL